MWSALRRHFVPTKKSEQVRMTAAIFYAKTKMGWKETVVIGIGGHLAVPPLPHHRAYGSVPRRFDWVKLEQGHKVGGDRVGRRSGFAGPVGPWGALTCARDQSVNRPRSLHRILARHAAAVPFSVVARSSL